MPRSTSTTLFPDCSTCTCTRWCIATLSPRTSSFPRTITARYPFRSSVAPSPQIVDFGVAHIFETLNNPGQASGRFSPFRSHADTNLPQSTRPLNTLTRTQTGLMTNTAGTTYFYPPECCLDQPYNTYAADVLASLASHVGLGAGRDALRDGGGPPAAVQPRPHRLHGRPAGEGHRDPHRPLARLAISLPAVLWPFTPGTCCGASSRRTPPSVSPWTRFLWGRRRGVMCRRTSG